MIVADVMTTDVVKVRPSMPLKEVAEILISRGISGVPVVDAEGRVLGVVSETDILAKEQGAIERVTPEELRADIQRSAVNGD